MKAFCITLYGHPYSETVAERCVRTARDIGKIEVEYFEAVSRRYALEVLSNYGLRWTWGDNRVLQHHPYGGSLETRVGCAMSHFLLWDKCAQLDEPILILEHDAVFVREFPEFEFNGICQINDPDGATRRGRWWHEQMVRRGTHGVHAKTWVTDDKRIPDGLAGNSAYVIKPHAARALIEKVNEIGLWPNDAIMCAQFFELQELFPFVTVVQQGQSTTNAAA